MSSSQQRFQYRPEIDGLRAVAVLGVFFYHLHWGALSGGWLGVDIFFVISGYLICSLLLREAETTKSISLSGFYLRRVRRIMPAFLFCLIGTFPMALIVSKTHIFTQYSQSAIAALFSVSNIFFWQHAGYFEIDSQLAPLIHTWTLGLEEQFYFIIPVLFLLIAKISAKRRQAIFIFLFMVTVASFLTCRYGKNVLSHSFLFYMLPTRMWELLIGLFTAKILFEKPEIRTRNAVTELLSISSFSFILFAFYSYRGGSSFAEKSLFSALATAVFIATTCEKSILGRVISCPPIRFVGQISYSVYLWHWPFIFLGNLLFLRYSWTPSPLSNLSILIVVLCVGTLSCKYIEIPFRKKTRWKECLPPVLVLACVVLLLSTLGITQLGGSQSTYTMSDTGGINFTSFKKMMHDDYDRVGPSDQPPQFIFIGDSHAKAISPAIVELSREYGIAGLAGLKDGTGPLQNIRRSHKLNDPPVAKHWLNYILKSKIKHILIIAKWDRYFFLDSWRYSGKHGSWSVATAMAELQETVQTLLTQGKEVWILDQVPRFKKDPILMTKIFDNTPWKEDLSQLEKKHFAHEALRNINSTHIHVMEPWPLLTQHNTVSSVRHGSFLYIDSNHPSTAGALAIKDVFRPMFEQIQSER